jgi:hypothetical protein
LAASIDQEVNEEIRQSENDGAPGCPETLVSAPSAPGTVIGFKATGKNYIVGGTDPNELYGNHYTLTDRTQNPQPASRA